MCRQILRKRLNSLISMLLKRALTFVSVQGKIAKTTINKANIRV